MASVKEKVFEYLAPIVDELGYELCEVEYAKKVNGMNLTLYIHSPKGITLDDCEIVHKGVDAPLDELDPTGGAPYYLNVSSLGLDRPVKTDADLERVKGETVDVSLYAKVNGKKEFTGTLKCYDEDSVTIEVNLKGLTFERKAIAKMVLHIDF